MVSLNELNIFLYKCFLTPKSFCVEYLSNVGLFAENSAFFFNLEPPTLNNLICKKSKFLRGLCGPGIVAASSSSPALSDQSS